jgi:hypothetical protein
MTCWNNEVLWQEHTKETDNRNATSTSDKFYRMSSTLGTELSSTNSGNGNAVAPQFKEN